MEFQFQTLGFVETLRNRHVHRRELDIWPVSHHQPHLIRFLRRSPSSWRGAGGCQQRHQ